MAVANLEESMTANDSSRQHLNFFECRIRPQPANKVPANKVPGPELQPRLRLVPDCRTPARRVASAAVRSA